MTIRADLPAPAESPGPGPQGRPMMQWNELVDLRRRTVRPRMVTDSDVDQVEEARRRRTGGAWKLGSG
jgi:hypothetical protein